jgi:cyclophilin family peptidyl-prolyl cis-trans isomerase
VSLAQSNFYSYLVWHRIIANFVIQTGDPNTKSGGGDRNAWGQGTSGQSVPFEYDSSLHNNVGYVAMASTGVGVGGSSQFYINVHDNSATLDGKYAVFGKVIAGMDAVNKLASSPTTNQYPGAPDQPTNPSAAMLKSVTISPYQ